MTLTPFECRVANSRMRCYETHRIKTSRRAIPTHDHGFTIPPGKPTPSRPVDFVPRRAVFCLYAAGIASIWSTGGYVAPERGVVVFK